MAIFVRDNWGIGSGNWSLMDNTLPHHDSQRYAADMWINANLIAGKMLYGKASQYTVLIDYLDVNSMLVSFVNKKDGCPEFGVVICHRDVRESDGAICPVEASLNLSDVSSHPFWMKARCDLGKQCGALDLRGLIAYPMLGQNAYGKWRDFRNLNKSREQWMTHLQGNDKEEDSRRMKKTFGKSTIYLMLGAGTVSDGKQHLLPIETQISGTIRWLFDVMAALRLEKILAPDVSLEEFEQNIRTKSISGLLSWDWVDAMDREMCQLDVKLKEIGA